jgi:hypothetical protein
MGDIAELINKYGFPIVAAAGMGYLIFYVWQWATKEIKPVLSEANTTLIALIDRIRMLDNDLIRLNQKVNTVLHLRGKIIESERVLEAVKVDSEADKKFRKAVADTDKDKKADAEKKQSDAEKKQPEKREEKETSPAANQEDPGYPLRPGEKPPEK